MYKTWLSIKGYCRRNVFMTNNIKMNINKYKKQ